MTEIKIEKKKLVWPWILGIGVVGLLIYFLAFNDKKEAKQEAKFTEDLMSVSENNRTVAAFVSFIDEDTMKMELDQTFTVEAFLKLVDATNVMAEEINYDVHSNMARVIKFVNRVKAEPIETSYANSFREGSDIITETVLKSMQQSKYPGLTREVTELENASAAINPEVLILDQKDAIKTFFQKAAELLRKMN